MNHRQRIETSLAGEHPDQIPVAFWRHFPVDDQDPGVFAESILDFQSHYDFDLVKITPSSSYCIADWGIVDEWKGNLEGTRDYLQRRIRQPEDWAKLEHLDPRKGALGKILQTIELVRRHLSANTPILMTIFDPMAQAKNLAGNDLLLEHVKTAPDAVLEGLKIISDTTVDFIHQLLPLDIDGIFLAVQHGQKSLLTRDEFEKFCAIPDESILAVSSKYWLNVLHLHGDDVYFDLLEKYPVQVLNWHDRQTSPSLRDAANRSSKLLCGGLERWDVMTYGNPASIKEQALEAVEQTGGLRFVLGTGCVLPIITPAGNIQAAVDSVRSLG
jgi:uroporphyrinogen decarboxylase